ncbi:putative methyltransferase-domain-containing protein [Xylariaceae sp. FL1272]|nr:putative methyltransferase-domain-containing protein [Xylariaceae sp. FL1272]
MHYIRLLRPARVERSSRTGLVLSVLFTITTDLGDAFLCPENGAHDLRVDVLPRPPLTHARTCSWKAGMRVLEVKFDLGPKLKNPSEVNCTVSIETWRQLPGPTYDDTQLGHMKANDLLFPPHYGTSKLGRDMVMPVTLQIKQGVCDDISYRTLAVDSGPQSKRLNLVIEEDIGESIARHIWDAGVLTSAYLAYGAYRSSIPEETWAFPEMGSGTFNILELGCGVGILGLMVASILPRVAQARGKTNIKSTVLLTDLEEAKDYALRNITRARASLEVNEATDEQLPRIEFETLDWDEGCNGRFGPTVKSMAWDLIILSDCTYNVDSLPALVGTLSALHDLKRYHQGYDTQGVKSSVLLATKTRHPSEQALEGILQSQHWRYLFPHGGVGVGDEHMDEWVRIYRLERVD